MFEQPAGPVYDGKLQNKKGCPVPILVILSLAIGASAALVCGVPRKHQLRDAWVPVLALLGFEGIIFAPCGAYLLWRYADWSFMYLLEAQNAPFLPWLWAIAYPISAVIGFFITRNLTRQRRLGAAWGWMIGCVAVAVAIGGFGYRQLVVVGSTLDFREGIAALPALRDSQLAYLLAGMAIACVVGWGVTLWRLGLFARAEFLRRLHVEESRQGGAQKPVPAS